MGRRTILVPGQQRIQLVADRAINAVRPFKVRRRGRGSGDLQVALAELMVVSGDHLLHLGELREDEAGAELRAWARCRPRPRRGS
jgi:hypothetical protein